MSVSLASIAPAKRTIKFDERTLADVPGYSAEEIRDFYARVYPELRTATIEENITAGGVEIILTTGYKSKG